jgi:hypothetical protein
MNSLILKTSQRTAVLLARSSPDFLVRSLATHWDPKFKKLRKQKFVKMKLPDFDKIRKDDMNQQTNEERRANFIKEGIEPPVSFEFKPFNITTSSRYLKFVGAKSL